MPASVATICIINSEGSLVMEFKTDSFDQTFIVPVWDWTSGGYWVQVVIDNQISFSQKFIKT
ncbi:MAG: T9SS type A sorting domain-containing protein [Bacteroidetes bacterium]|nr:T9SS type A sorting domain-containing protein [Bacteroidota bacterium]